MRASSRSTRRARTTGSSSSPCATSRAATSGRCCGATDRWSSSGRWRCSSQIASALDAAHRSGLVHRDVKPANILVDDDDHAYLTDFGVSKQLGGVTTDTGRLVGSLDYLAPEQIAGERVDPRTDQYALACVLYECLTGTPAFRRESEAETLWAHMQRTVRADPRARAGVQAGVRARARSTLRQLCGDDRGRASAGAAKHGAWLAAVPVVVAGLAVALGLLLRDGADAASGRELRRRASARTAVSGRSPTPRRRRATSPSAKGAVWVLDSEAEIVARIDPGTKAVTRFWAGPRPTDLAVGGGAVWVGNGVGTKASTAVTTDISRVDPRTPEDHGHGRSCRASRACTGRCRARASRGWRSAPGPCGRSASTTGSTASIPRRAGSWRRSPWKRG